MAAKVSFEALGMSESGSSNRSSTQVPPLTAVPPPCGVGVVPVVLPPEVQALNSMSSTARAEKDITRKRDLGFLSIVSSWNSKKYVRGTRLPTYRAGTNSGFPWAAHHAAGHWTPQKLIFF